MNYEPIITKINYWKDYDGMGDAYRKTHDLDCVLTNGNLFADTIFSLWLPLRYTLNYFDCSKWIEWKEYEAKNLRPKHMGLKDCNEFLEDIVYNIEIFLPEHILTKNLIELFQIGQTRTNVMVLPYRKWNTARGGSPYWDYMPHYLFDILDTDNKTFLDAVVKWIEEEKLMVFFEEGIIDKEHIKDLAGTGNACSHSPSRISVSILLKNYIEILQEREALLDIVA